MSRTRAVAREARVAAQAAEAARTRRVRSRGERVAKLAGGKTGRPRRVTARVRGRNRRVRYGSFASFLVLQLAIWQLVDDTQTRLGLGVLTLALLPIATHLMTDPRSRR